MSETDNHPDSESSASERSAKKEKETKLLIHTQAQKVLLGLGYGSLPDELKVKMAGTDFASQFGETAAKLLPDHLVNTPNPVAELVQKMPLIPDPEAAKQLLLSALSDKFVDARGILTFPVAGESRTTIQTAINTSGGSVDSVYKANIRGAENFQGKMMPGTDQLVRRVLEAAGYINEETFSGKFTAKPSYNNLYDQRLQAQVRHGERTNGSTPKSWSSQITIRVDN